MAKSQGVRDLEQLEKDIHKQAELVNQYMHLSIEHGYSSKGKEYEQKQAEAQKVLNAMERKYQLQLGKATNILRNI